MNDQARQPKKTVEPRALKGFIDHADADARWRAWASSTLGGIADAHAFTRLDTPALEYGETLFDSGGGENEKQSYAFTDAGGRMVGLRYDLTVPFARYAAEHFPTLVLPFKRFQTGNVWRGEKPQKGRYREFAQADFDIIGAGEGLSDVSVLLAVTEGLLAIAPGYSFTVLLNHRTILERILDTGISDLTADEKTNAIVEIDKRHKIGDEKLRVILQDKFGPRLKGNSLFECLDAGPQVVQMAGFLPEAADKREKISNALEYLRRCTEVLHSTHPKLETKIDLSLARGLGYYTGMVFECVCRNHPTIGSVASGGRYDNLLAKFGRRDVGGVGGSIGVDRVLALLKEQSSVVSPVTIEIVGLAVQGQVTWHYVTRVLRELKNQGLGVDLCVSGGKFATQMKYLDRRGHRCVVILGEDEEKSEVVTVKDFRTGQQQTTSVATAASYLMELLNARAQ